jgi:hypothetical protein
VSNWWRLAHAQGDNTRRARAQRALGCTLLWLGEFESSSESLRQGIELWEVKKSREAILVYGEDASVVCRCFGSWSLWFLGRVDRSRLLIGEALADSEQLASPFIVVWALNLASAL